MFQDIDGKGSVAGPGDLCRDHGRYPQRGSVRADVLAWEQKHMASFRTASIERARRELSSAEIVNVPGTHMDFLFTSREKVVAAMQRFLGGSAPQK